MSKQRRIWSVLDKIHDDMQISSLGHHGSLSVFLVKWHQLPQAIDFSSWSRNALKDTLMTTKKRDSRYGRLIRGNLIGSSIARLVHFGDAGRRRIQQINGKYLKEYYPNVWINTQLPIRSTNSSDSRYHKGIVASAENRPKGGKDQYNAYRSWG